MSSKSFQNASKLNGIVSVLQFGAVCDGATDDTAAIQAAINYAFNSNGKQISIPGFSVISAPLVIPVPPGTPEVSEVYSTRIELVGTGFGSGLIAAASFTGSVMIQVNGPINIGNMLMNGGGKANFTGIKVDHVVGSYKSIISKIAFVNFNGNNTRAFWGNGRTWDVIDCTGWHCYIGIHVGNKSINSNISKNLFVGTSTSLAQIFINYDVDADIPQGINITDNITIGNGYGILSYGCYMLNVADNVIDMTVDDGTSPVGDANIGAKFAGENRGAYTTRNEHVTITNNWFAGGQNPAGGTQNGRSLWIGGWTKEAYINGNTFPQSTPVVIEHTSNVIANGAPSSIRLCGNNFINAYNPSPLNMLILSNANTVKIDDANVFRNATWYAENSVNVNWDTLRVEAAPTFIGMSGQVGGWSQFAITVTPSSPGGTLPTIPTFYGRYRLDGRTVFVSLYINITNIGVGNSGNLVITGLPTPATDGVMVGRLNNSSALLRLFSGSSTGNAFLYDGSYPGGATGVLAFNGSYEAAFSFFI